MYFPAGKLAGNGNGNGTPINEDVREPETPFDFHDDPIRDFVSDGDHDDPNADASDKGDKVDDTAISPAVQAQLDKFSDRLAESDQVIQFLKGQNSILEGQVRGDGRKEEKVETPEPLLKVDKAKIQAALSDPETAADSLLEMFTNFGENILKRVNKVQEATRGEFQSRDQHEAWRGAMAADRKDAVEEYGEDVLNNAEFIKEADKELERILGERGAKSIYDMKRGDFTGVASRIYNRWLRNGKIALGGKPATSTNGNNNRKPSIRELNTEIAGERFQSNGGGGEDRRNGGALSWETLYPNEKDRSIAKNAAHKMGVSDENWLKGYAKSRSEDESYGR